MTTAERTRRYYWRHRYVILARRRRKYYSDPNIRLSMVKRTKLSRLADRWLAEAA